MIGSTMIASRRLAVAGALALLVFSSASRTASADDDPRKKSAEVTFQEGVRLHQQGKNDEALVKLKKAYETYPSPNTLGGIARVEHALGRSLEALRHYREALRNPLIHPENAEHARGAIKELEKDLARVDVKGPKGLGVTIDGAEYVLPLAEPIDLKAQTLELSGTLAGVKYEARATAPIGRITVIEMTGPAATTTGAAAAGAGAPSVATPSVPEPKANDNTARNLVSGALVGLGLVGVGLGVGFTVAANGSSSDLARAKEATGPDGNGACVVAQTSACADRARAADDLASNTNVARAMYIGGGIALVGGVVAFLLWPRSSAASGGAVARERVVPWIGSGTTGVSYGGSF